MSRAKLGDKQTYTLGVIDVNGVTSVEKDEKCVVVIVAPRDLDFSPPGLGHTRVSL